MVQGITSEVQNLSRLMDVAPVPHMPQGDSVLRIWNVQHGVSEVRKAKDRRLGFQPLQEFKGLSCPGKHWGRVFEI